MRYTDIREVKKALRTQFKTIRRSFPPEEQRARDEAILKKLTALKEYQQASLILTYVSTAIEVDTHRLIRQALQEGKKVAVPWCVPGKVDMKFYLIDRLEDLEPGSFGVLEPVPGRHRELKGTVNEKDLKESFCVLPGLGFDLCGYRLGYGKGYYDRFLSGYPGVTAGVCYTACLKTQLPHGRYDRMMDILVTEKFTKRFSAPVLR
jgi:5-formyltetrahydrofolate cyclo-ligase